MEICITPEVTFVTSEEFEHWLSSQTLKGWTVRNPESIEQIRADFKAGAKLAPMLETNLK